MLPVVKAHEVETSDPKCRLTGIVVAGLALLTSNCAEPCNFCFSEAFMNKFRDLGDQFNFWIVAPGTWSIWIRSRRPYFSKP